MVATKNEQILTATDIEDLEIINYFKTINQGKFEETAALFAEAGELLAPFEKPIIGRQAIASYLTQEAQGMKLLPKQGTKTAIASEQQQINITGQVKTSLFTVNVGWYFTLNQEQKIIMVKIKLLASPQELLGLKNIKSRLVD